MNDMLLDIESYQRCFEGYSIVDCVARDKDTHYFVALSDYDRNDPPPEDEERFTRVIALFADLPMEKRWAWVQHQGLDGLLAGVAHQPKSQFVGVDRTGQVLVIGGGERRLEQRMPAAEQGPRRGGVRRLRTIGGRLWASTGYRGLGRRDGADQWVSLCANLQLAAKGDDTSDAYGFDDFDAFDEQDVYCAGGSGDLWHYNGRDWTRIEFPSNAYLETICCAEDGVVYIGAQNGAIFAGREDEWRRLVRGDMTLPYKDIVSFRGRVFCTSDYGLWEIKDGKLQDVALEPKIKVCAGNLSIAGGVMLMAGVYGAALFDGTDWQPIFDTASFTFTRGGQPPA